MSCSHKSEIPDDYFFENTLRYKVENRQNSVSRSSEIEKDRLTRNISQIETINSSVALSPLAVLSSSYAKNTEPLYPYLEGFGSLDTSKIEENLRETVNSFCRAISGRENASSFMESGSIFELALFMKDIKDNWEEVFEEEFPKETENTEEMQPSDGTEPVSDTQTDTGTGQNETAETAAQMSPEKPKIPLFTSYFFGKEIKSENSTEIPVRFSFKNGFVDVMIYFIEENENSWKINQLTILQMTKT